VILTFDLFDHSVNACRDPTIEYAGAKFGVDSSDRFPFKVRIHTQTQIATDVTDHPIIIIIIIIMVYCAEAVVYLQYTTQKQSIQESLALASMARKDPPQAPRRAARRPQCAVK